MKRLMGMIMMVMMMGLMGCGDVMWGWHRGSVPEVVHAVHKIPVWVDDRFNADEKEAIRFGIGEWIKVFNGQVEIWEAGKFVDDDGGAEVLQKLRRTNEGWIIVRYTHEDVYGLVPNSALAFAIGGRMMGIIVDRIGNRDLRMIVAHEMGHLLGSPHMNFNGIMHPYYGGGHQYRCLDKAVVMQVAAALGLNWRELNWCVTPEWK